MPSTINRTLHYRSVAFTVPTSGLSLQQLVTAALGALPNAEQRERKMVGEEKDNELLNSHAVVGPTLCGIFHRWTPGVNQLVVDRIAGRATWEVKEVAPPPPLPATPVAGEPPAPEVKRDFLPHTLYFGVKDNHCVVAQSQGLRSEHLASYLSWLLKSSGPGIAVEGQQITLYPASAALLRQKGVSRAKGISIKTRLCEEVLKEPAPGDRKKKPWIERVLDPVKVAAMRGILDALDVKVSEGEISTDEAKHLELYLEIRRPHDKSDMGNSIMNRIASIVAEKTDENYCVILPDGSELQGTELTLRKPVSFEVPTNAPHPNPAHVFKQINDYLLELIASDVV